MIQGSCFTNLDKWRRADWPTVFAAVPRVGEYVQGVMGEFRPKLRVVAVTHFVEPSPVPPFEIPRISVELHQ